MMTKTRKNDQTRNRTKANSIPTMHLDLTRRLEINLLKNLLYPKTCYS